MQHPDEGTIHAWIDGALSTEEASQIEAHVADCAECRGAVAEARGLIAASSRIVSALDIVPGGVIPVRAPMKRAWYTSTQFRAAAAVLFVAGASFLVVRGRDGAPISDAATRVMSAPVAEPPQVMPSPRASTDGLTEAAPADVQAKAPASARATVEPQRLEDRSARMEQSSQARGDEKRSDAAAKVGGEVAGAATGVGATASPDAVVAALPAPTATSSASAAAAPPPESPKVAARDAAANRAGFIGMLKAAPVVVTAEKELAEGKLKLVSVDSAAGTKITHYETADGVALTLVETTLSPLPTATVRRSARAAESKRDLVEADQTVYSINWSNIEKGRSYVLTGKLSPARLEEYRKVIEAGVR